jgi:hypothetical protein
MAIVQSVLRPSQPHAHIQGAQCPVCDQPVPNEKADQVRARIEARDRAAAETVTLRLKEQFAAERAQIEASGRAALEKAQREGAAGIEAVRKQTAAAIELVKSQAEQKQATAREEGVKAAQAAAQQQIAALARAKADADAAAKQKIEALTQANADARAAAQQQVKVAQAAAQQQITALTQAKADADATARQKIEALTRANADAHAAAQEQVAQAERAKAEVEAAARERIAAAETAKLTAESAAKNLKENHEALLNERLQEQREALEKDKATALNARDAKHFEENQKLKDKLDEAVRKLEQKTAEELGEGAHLDLLEELKDHFEGDRIRRVPRGTPGADIIHEIIEDGKVCGKIVYDSKNRNGWRTEYATKLCEDKIAEGADHAILSLLKFPADARQLDIREGVILANPARVTVIAEILRDDIVRAHCLRLSNQEREKKKDELYAYITGERFRQHLDGIESQTNKLLDIDVAEEKAHRKVWEARGTVVKTLRKTEGNLRADVARIIGTRDAAE